MLVKINKKPIHVIEEEETESKDWILFGIKCVGYFLILCIMDYVCFTFFYVHPLPFLAKISQFIGGIL